MKTVLILGGAMEGRALAANLEKTLGARVRILTSLAGVVEPSRPLAGELRVGTFADSSELGDFIQDEGIALVVDATHPYATKISSLATAACARAEVPRLQLVRAPWRQPSGSKWLNFKDMTTCAEVLPTFAQRVFLTIGSRGPRAFEGIDGVHFVARMIAEPETPFNIPSLEIMLARPPFDLKGERALMRRHDIDTLVMKNSGGEATAAKIEAARDLGVKICCIDRPAPEPGDRAATVADAQAWIEARV